MKPWNINDLPTQMRQEALQRLQGGGSPASVPAIKTSGRGSQAPSRSLWNDLTILLLANGLPPACSEYKFCPSRRFRADFAWPDHKLLLEVEGGVFSRQAHGSISGLLRDIEKYSIAASLGWRVIRVLPADLLKTKTVELLKQSLRFKTEKV